MGKTGKYSRKKVSKGGQNGISKMNPVGSVLPFSINTDTRNTGRKMFSFRAGNDKMTSGLLAETILDGNIWRILALF